MTLTEIANQLGCDKGTLCAERHGYTELYDTAIDPRSRLLEVGIDAGLSVAMWKQWSADIHLIAIDNRPACITTEVAAACDARLCDQSNAAELSELARSVGVLDVIIDDGSHDPDHQILTLETLWVCLRNGGLYFIEDLHTSAWYPPIKNASRRISQFAERHNATLRFECQNKLAWLVKI